MKDKTTFYNVALSISFLISMGCLSYVLFLRHKESGPTGNTISPEFISRQFERIYTDWIDESFEKSVVFDQPDSALMNSDESWTDFNDIKLPNSYLLFNIPYEGCGKCMYEQFEILGNYLSRTPFPSGRLFVIAPITMQREILILSSKNEFPGDVQFIFASPIHEVIKGANSYRLSYYFVDNMKIVQSLPDPPNSFEIISYYLHIVSMHLNK